LALIFDGKYFLTSFGKIVYEAQLLIGRAEQNFWKFRGIDSVCSSAQGMSAEEHRKIIETLIVEDDLKEIFLDRSKTTPVEKSIYQPPSRAAAPSQQLSAC
jgi:hypothetical protein